MSSCEVQSFDGLSTPVFVLEMQKLEQNLKLIDEVQSRGGVKILLALKGFALYESFPLISRYLCGTSASSLNEVILSDKKFSKEVHTYSPAYKSHEIDEIASMSDSVIFNSLSQYERYYLQIKDKTSCGLRINLEMPFDIPNHCNPNRKDTHLGIKKESLKELPRGVEGLHIHALCFQDSYALEEVLLKLQEEFSSYLDSVKWLNLGGGHAITSKDYDKEHLIASLQKFSSKFPHLQIYMEPSQAIVYDSGILLSTVLDIVHTGIDIAVLDISVEVHLSDLFISKIPPHIQRTTSSGYSYQLAGNSCLAGDIFGTYCFGEPLKIGDRLVLTNQMSYTMVKATSYNGINPANIAIKEVDGTIRVVKEFLFEDYYVKL